MNFCEKDYSAVKKVEDCYKGGLEDFVFTFANRRIKRELYLRCKYLEEPMIVFGESSCGKTFLASCIEKEALRKNIGYMKETQEMLMCHILDNIRCNGLEEKVYERYTDYDVIVFDEIEEIRNRNTPQRILAKVVWELHKLGKNVILLGMEADQGYAALLENFQRVYTLQSLKKKQKVKYICKILKKAGLKLKSLDIHRMSDKDMGILIGALNRLLFSTSEERKKGRLFMDPERVKNVLGKSFYEE